jgi:hypothetical protein
MRRFGATATQSRGGSEPRQHGGAADRSCGDEEAYPIGAAVTRRCGGSGGIATRRHSAGQKRRGFGGALSLDASWTSKHLYTLIKGQFGEWQTRVAAILLCPWGTRVGTHRSASLAGLAGLGDGVMNSGAHIYIYIYISKQVSTVSL